MSQIESRIAALLSVLTESEDASQCPLSVFSRGLREVAWTQQRLVNGNAIGGEGAVDLSDVLAERSLALLREEEAILCDKEVVQVAYDKLRAEMARVEAQLQSLERRAQEVVQQKAFCKFAMNVTVMGAVPDFYVPNGERVLGVSHEDADLTGGGNNTCKTTVGGLEGLLDVAPATSAMTKQPCPSPPLQRKQLGQDQEQLLNMQSTNDVKQAKGNDLAPLVDKSERQNNNKDDGKDKRSSALEKVTSRAWNSVGSTLTGSALLAMLRLPDVKEETLLHAIDSYNKHHFGKPAPWSTVHQQEVLPVLLGLLKHLPQPRPPVQVAELRILGHVFRAASNSQNRADSKLSSSSSSPPGPLSLPEVAANAMLHILLQEGKAVATLTGLLQSVNDDVKCEVLECLLPLVSDNSSGGNGAVKATERGGVGRQKTSNVRKEFIAAGGLQPLISIVASCTSEAVLERSLVLLWGLLARNDDEEKVRHEVRRLGGLRAVLDLLYTDSLPILENVAMTIGYITREEASKVEIREAGGLENITATLRHPHESIQTKMAGAVWNCASNTENRAYLRHIGCIPALLELLGSPYEFVQENAAGALWNLSVDPENKAQILDYGGVAELANLIEKSYNVSVVENASGTLWNCSAAVETRPAIRKAAAIPVLLSVLDRKLPPSQQSQGSAAEETSSSLLPMSDKILDNVAGTLRNCAINDQNKPAIREAGGVELLLKKLEQGILKQPASILLQTLDKMASTLWILTISPEIKHSVRISGGIPLLAKMLEAASVTAAKKKGARSVVQLPISVKEKIVGILRNCSTVQENRPAMVAAGVVRVLVHVVEDCYLAPNTLSNTKQSATSQQQQQQQQQQQPSLQLKETVASALWYLSRDDKVVPRQEGGLELLCRLLQEPDQPSVVLEQAAGALSSLTVNSQENRTKLREFGGLRALLQLIEEKTPLAFPQQMPGDSDSKAAATANSSVGRAVSTGSSVNKTESTVSHTYAVLNALLAVRNSTSSNEENLRCVAEWRRHRSGEESSQPNSFFTASLLYIIQYGSEDCAREAALCVKNLCGHAKTLELLQQQGAVELLGKLTERGSTDSVRRAAAMTLHSLTRTQRR